MGIFVYRERFLAYELALAERKHLLRLDLNATRMNELYTNSVACLVTFDPSSQIVDRVSSGFFTLLGISANKNLAGASLEEVLGVDSAQLTNVVYQIKTSSAGVREQLACQQADGKPVQLLMSGYYIPQLHLIEASFVRLPRKALADQERLIEDLERFKKGIVRREDRVLELKAQVNEMLQQAGQPVRYQVDSNTDVSRLVKQEFITKEAMKHE